MHAELDSHAASHLVTLLRRLPKVAGSLQPAAAERGVPLVLTTFTHEDTRSTREWLVAFGAQLLTSFAQLSEQPFVLPRDNRLSQASLFSILCTLFFAAVLDQAEKRGPAVGSAGVEMRDIDGTRAKIVKLRDDLKQADVTHSTAHVEAAWASLRTVQQDVFKLQSMAGIEIKVIPDQWDLDNATEEAAAVEPQEQ